MGNGRAGPERVIGRYALFDRIAAGGMATVHLGRMMGPAAFRRVVAIKRMLPRFARDQEFVRMFLAEARLTTRVRHPNVVSATDVVSEDGELFLVMDYVEGESLARLLEVGSAGAERAPVDVAVAIMSQALHGLHAAHEAKSETGEPLGIVHRDVSPQNILVGVDGLARVVDFGIAKAAGGEETRRGVLKGKAAYMAPEQIRVERLDRRVDVYAAAVVLWESLAGERLFVAETSPEVFEKILASTPRPLVSSRRKDVSAALDAVVARGLARAPDERFATALEMAEALEAAVTPASPRAVSRWVESIASDTLRARRDRVAACEAAPETAPSRASEPDDRGARDANDERGVTALSRRAPFLVRPLPRDEEEPPPAIEETKPIVRAPVVVPAAEGAPWSSPSSSRTSEPSQPVAPAPASEPSRGAPPSSPSHPEAVERADPLAPSGPADDPDQGPADAPRAELPTSSSARRLFVVVAVASGALTLVVGAAAVGARRPSPVERLSLPRVATSSPTPLPGLVTAVSASAPLEPPPSASASAAEDVDDAPSASPSSSSAKAVRPPHGARCKPPFYYEGGLKKFKRGCL